MDLNIIRITDNQLLCDGYLILISFLQKNQIFLQYKHTINILTLQNHVLIQQTNIFFLITLN